MFPTVCLNFRHSYRNFGQVFHISKFPASVYLQRSYSIGGKYDLRTKLRMPWNHKIFPKVRHYPKEYNKNLEKTRASSRLQSEISVYKVYVTLHNGIIIIIIIIICFNKLNSISRLQSNTLLIFCLKVFILIVWKFILFLKWYTFVFSSSIKGKSFSLDTNLIKVNSFTNFEVFSAVNKNVELWVLIRCNLVH